MTMIEVLMAIVVAMIGLLGALAMISMLFRSATFSRNLSEATSLVQSRLETQVTLTPISLTTSLGTTTEAVMDALGQTTGAGPFLYTRTTVWSLSSDGKRCKIAVTVSFNDAAGIQHNVTAERERNTP